MGIFRTMDSGEGSTHSDSEITPGGGLYGAQQKERTKKGRFQVRDLAEGGENGNGSSGGGGGGSFSVAAVRVENMDTGEVDHIMQDGKLLLSPSETVVAQSSDPPVVELGRAELSMTTSSFTGQTRSASVPSDTRSERELSFIAGQSSAVPSPETLSRKTSLEGVQVAPSVATGSIPPSPNPAGVVFLVESTVGSRSSTAPPSTGAPGPASVGVVMEGAGGTFSSNTSSTPVLQAPPLCPNTFSTTSEGGTIQSATSSTFNSGQQQQSDPASDRADVQKQMGRFLVRQIPAPGSAAPPPGPVDFSSMPMTSYVTGMAPSGPAPSQGSSDTDQTATLGTLLKYNQSILSRLLAIEGALSGGGGGMWSSEPGYGGPLMSLPTPTPPAPAPPVFQQPPLPPPAPPQQQEVKEKRQSVGGAAASSQQTGGGVGSSVPKTGQLGSNSAIAQDGTGRRAEGGRLSGIIDQLRLEVEVHNSARRDQELEVKAVRDKCRALEERVKEEQSKSAAAEGRLDKIKARNRALMSEVASLRSALSAAGIAPPPATESGLPAGTPTAATALAAATGTGQQRHQHSLSLPPSVGSGALGLDQQFGDSPTSSGGTLVHKGSNLAAQIQRQSVSTGNLGNASTWGSTGPQQTSASTSDGTIAENVMKSASASSTSVKLGPPPGGVNSKAPAGKPQPASGITAASKLEARSSFTSGTAQVNNLGVSNLTIDTAVASIGGGSAGPGSVSGPGAGRSASVGGGGAAAAAAAAAVAMFEQQQQTSQSGSSAGQGGQAGLSMQPSSSKALGDGSGLLAPAGSVKSQQQPFGFHKADAPLGAPPPMLGATGPQSSQQMLHHLQHQMQAAMQIQQLQSQQSQQINTMQMQHAAAQQRQQQQQQQITQQQGQQKQQQGQQKQPPPSHHFTQQQQQHMQIQQQQMQVQQQLHPHRRSASLSMDHIDVRSHGALADAFQTAPGAGPVHRTSADSGIHTAIMNAYNQPRGPMPPQQGQQHAGGTQTQQQPGLQQQQSSWSSQHSSKAALL